MERPEENGEQIVNIIDREKINFLESLGVNFTYEIKDNKLIFNFLNAVRIAHSAFLLDAGDKKILYKSLHFDNNEFSDTEDKRKIDSDKIPDYFKEKFPDVDEFILSCCNPDGARKILEGLGVIIFIIGSGSGTYSTWYDKEKKIVSNISN